MGKDTSFFLSILFDKNKHILFTFSLQIPYTYGILNKTLCTAILSTVQTEQAGDFSLCSRVAIGLTATVDDTSAGQSY